MVCVLLGTGTRRAVAQEELAPFSKSAIYVELLGQGLLYSVNYDYRFTPHFGVRAGFTSWSIPTFAVISVGELSLTGFPITVNYLSGDGTSHLELGIGIVPMTFTMQGQDIFFGTQYEGEGSTVLGTATLGYRAQPRDGGFVFRIGFTPLFNLKKVFPLGGLSLGVAF